MSGVPYKLLDTVTLSTIAIQIIHLYLALALPMIFYMKTRATKLFPATNIPNQVLSGSRTEAATAADRLIPSILLRELVIIYIYIYIQYIYRV